MACPIARALDRLGDRWSLLIVRDLHAGPMRFGEIGDGLPGLATNLLTSRLRDLMAEGLVAKDGPHYALTEAGLRTDAVLWELARFGMSLPPDPDLRPTGHLRLLAVTLQSAMRHSVMSDVDLTSTPLVTELIVDDNHFVVDLRDQPTVTFGIPLTPDVVVRTSYEPLLAAAAGDISLERFRSDHLAVDGDPASVDAFLQIMAQTMTVGFEAVP